MDEIVEKLKELGLSGNEAKVYLALVKKYPSTGYEVSKLANIQQARAYDALKSLMAKQIVTTNNKKPVEYSPIKPSELTKRYKRKLNTTLDFLDKKLPAMKETVLEPIVSVSGSAETTEKITELFQSAKDKIYLLISSSDYKYFEPVILDAYNRGIEIKISGYDNLLQAFGDLFIQTPMSVLDSKSSSRLIMMTIDDKEGFWGAMKPNSSTGNIECLWSQNPDVVFLIKSYITHSMYITDIEDKFPEQLKYFYGAGMKKLRDKVLN